MFKIKTHAEDFTATLFKNLDIHSYVPSLCLGPLRAFLGSHGPFMGLQPPLVSCFWNCRDIVMYAPIVLEALGHREEQLRHILNVYLLKSKLFLFSKNWVLAPPLTRPGQNMSVNNFGIKIPASKSDRTFVLTCHAIFITCTLASSSADALLLCCSEGQAGARIPALCGLHYHPIIK